MVVSMGMMMAGSASPFGRRLNEYADAIDWDQLEAIDLALRGSGTEAAGTGARSDTPTRVHRGVQAAAQSG